MVALIRAAVERGVTSFRYLGSYGPLENEDSWAKFWRHSAAEVSWSPPNSAASRTLATRTAECSQQLTCGYQAGSRGFAESSERTRSPWRSCWLPDSRVAQTWHVTSLSGTWKLSLAKSEFNPGPPFKSFTLTFTPDGTRILVLVVGSGQPLEVSLPWSNGKAVTPNGRGMQATRVVSKINGNTVDDT